MEAIQSTLGTAGQAAAQTTRKDDAQATADRFLTMLVAQLKNQDPLNPLDNAQVTTQMAQISTVEGINKLNATVAALTASFGAAQSLQAATMVGRQVLVDGAALQLENGQAHGGFTLDAAADAVTLTVKSASGAVVHKADLGALGAGVHTFDWDGTADTGAAAAAGAYTFEITARSGKETVAAKPLMRGLVDGVTPSAEGSQLSLGRQGTAKLADVKHIY